MSYRYIITLDVDAEGHHLNSDTNVYFAVTDDQKEQQITSLSRKFPSSTICVYQLRELAKLKNKPTYGRYKVLDNGEVVPE